MIEKQTSLDHQNGPERNSSSAMAPTSASLPDSVLEKLYRSYALKQKRSALVTFIIASILFDFWVVFLVQGINYAHFGKFCNLIYGFKALLTYFLQIKKVSSSKKVLNCQSQNNFK
jgi:hypothetical protein